jgi:hypothetical protein
VPSGFSKRIDGGNPPPPIKLSDVRSLLKIDLKYYSSTDPSFLQEITHRFTLLARKTIPDVGKHLVAALSKSKLDAFLDTRKATNFVG